MSQSPLIEGRNACTPESHEISPLKLKRQLPALPYLHCIEVAY